MAGGRIRGITVEIGGDTTGLDKALKSVNSTIKTTQTSLKDVNKLLKFDPANTSLVTQKQKLLKDAISATKEKLDALKTAQEQAKQQLENGTLGQDKYDALQREIVETEQELQRLQQEASKTGTVLSGIDETGKKFEKAGNTIAGAGKAVMPVSAVVAGLGAAAVKTSSDFDSAMSQVAAVSGATGKDFDDLRGKAREMGSKTKFSASEAAEAMNYMAMAGWKTGDMLEGIEGVMNLAAASGEDLGTTSDIVTDALTAFGLSAKDSGHFADILAAASSNANTNVSMMGETFKYCAPIAGAMGYSAEDTAQAIGLMANAGIKGSSAGTALRTIMTKLQGDLKLSGAAFGDMTVKTTNADGSMRDLNDILADCRVAFGQMTESEKAHAAETLVGKNAMSGFLALMNAAPADVEKLETAISTCSDEIDGYNGTAEKMAAVMQDNLGGQLTILKFQIEELAISFGDMLMPTVRKIVTAVQGFVDKLNGMSEGQRNAILKVGLFVAALGPFLVILGTCIAKIGIAMQGFVKLAGTFGKLKTAVSGANGVFGKIGAALGGVSAPVVAVVAIIAVLVAAFLHLWRTNDGFREAIIGTWERIKTAISGFVEGIKERLSALGISFSSVAQTISTIWNSLCSVLAPVFEGAFNVIATVLETALGVLTGLFDVFIGIFTGNWQLSWTGVKEVFTSIWNGIGGVFSAVINTISGIANEKHMGDARLQKTYTVDFLTKKRVRNEGEIPQYYVENSHEGIIPKIEWDAVQMELERRKNYCMEVGIGGYGVASVDGPFTSKIVCGHCGAGYQRHRWPNRGEDYWSCRNKAKKNGATCKSENVKNDILRKVMVIAWNAVVKERDKLIGSWEEMKKSGNPLQALRARQMIELTAQGTLVKEVPELTRMVLERIVIHDKRHFTVRFLDGTVKEVIVAG